MAELAIHGGTPIREKKIPYHRPPVGNEEIQAVSESIESQWIVGPGPNCREVEERIEDRWDVPRALTVTSCTHALELALLSMDLDPDDEVLVPSFTYVSTATAVLRSGAKPIFVDIDPDTLTLTPETIRSATTPNTQAVIMVYYGGHPGPADTVKQFCEEKSLTLIEDAAQAYDTYREGQPAGTFGRFGAFSFHGTKPLTSGEGGMLLVNDENDINLCEMIRDKGTDRSVTTRGDEDRYTWRSIGSSYVLSDILGGLLRAQFDRWPEIKQERLKNKKKINDFLFEIDEEDHLDILMTPDGAEGNGHITGLLIPWKDQRDWFLEALQAEGIQAREHYHPLHLSPFAQEKLNWEKPLPAAEDISSRLIRLPSHTELSPSDLEAVKKGFRKVYMFFLENYSK